MNMKFIEAREHIAQAREAMRRGDREIARGLGERAALLAPEMEDAWLILAASDPDPQEALAYARKALEINPQSARARRGVDWASGVVLSLSKDRLNQPVSENSGAQSSQSDIAANPARMQAYQTALALPRSNPRGRNWLLALFLIGAGCIAFGFIALFAWTNPALASIVSGIDAPAPTQETLWASVDIPKPTPIDASLFAAQAADTPTSAPTSAPTDVPTSAPTDAPTSIPTEAPTFIPEATETPGVLAMEVVLDTPTSAYVPPAEAQQAQYPAKGNGARWIDVNLSEQRVYAYEGDVIVNSFLVSTGTARTPTVTGKFKIWIKLKSTTMRGPGYYLTNVPYTMYFHKGYGLHGTYWHNNFGTPMSHGCVNLSIPDSEWLYYWAMEGTTVNVHY